MISDERLVEICESYSSADDFTWGGAISQKKRNQIFDRFGIPDDDLIIAFFDHTLLGTAKDALVIASSGIYNRNHDELVSYTWENLTGIEISTLENTQVSKLFIMSDSQVIDCGGCGADLEKDIVSLIKDLLNELPPPDLGGWYLGEDGEQFGPYEKKVIFDLVVDPGAALVWKEGMAGWEPFRDIFPDY